MFRQGPESFGFHRLTKTVGARGRNPALGRVNVGLFCCPSKIPGTETIIGDCFLITSPIPILTNLTHRPP